jgi:hypothetical protein
MVRIDYISQFRRQAAGYGLRQRRLPRLTAVAVGGQDSHTFSIARLVREDEVFIMKWIVFVAGAVLSWGAYGALLHQGQTALGSPLKALLCVGVAYFLIGVLVPVATLGAQGDLSNFNHSGLITATIAGALGAAGAACIIYSFRFGGIPLYVMPLVFGGAPVVNVLISMAIHPPKDPINPLMLLGVLLAASGAGMVLFFRPKA